jgi:uncharacterized protein (DUF779 family)
MTERVDLTPAAADLLRRLVSLHGPVIFQQSGASARSKSRADFPWKRPKACAS